MTVSPPTGAIIASIRSGDLDLAGRPLDLTMGNSKSLAITISYRIASLSGVVTPSSTSDTGPLQSYIVLIPSPIQNDGSGLVFGTTDSTGHFSIDNIAPGHYHVVALERVDLRIFQNDILLQKVAALGPEIDLETKTTQSVEIPLIAETAFSETVGNANSIW